MLLRYGPSRQPLSHTSAVRSSPDLASLEPFLFAEVGRQGNGLPLTVNSMLARQGKDPWTEAESLARLPTGQAVESLAAAISVAPLHENSETAATATAIRLLRLLHCTRESRPSRVAKASDRAVGHMRRGAGGPHPTRKKHRPGQPRHGMRLGILIGAGLILLAIGLTDPKALFTDPDVPTGTAATAHPDTASSGH